jgi:hypothetical protein
MPAGMAMPGTEWQGKWPARATVARKAEDVSIFRAAKAGQ